MKVPKVLFKFQCLTLLKKQCHPDELRDFVEHGSHDPVEFPFMEEQSILRRLEATLFTLRNWSVTKSKAAVNNWHVRDFVLITQGDLLNTQDCYTLLQVSHPFYYTFLTILQFYNINPAKEHHFNVRILLLCILILHS